MIARTHFLRIKLAPYQALAGRIRNSIYRIDSSVGHTSFARAIDTGLSRRDRLTVHHLRGPAWSGVVRRVQTQPGGALTEAMSLVSLTCFV